VLVCPKCRNRVSAKDKFCFTCGTKLGNDDKQSEELTEDGSLGKREPQPTDLDTQIFNAIGSEFKRPEEIAEITGLALPEVMKGLRELLINESVVVLNAEYGSRFSGISNIRNLLDKSLLNTKEIANEAKLPIHIVDKCLCKLEKDGLIFKKKDYYVSMEYREKWYSKKRHQLKWLSIELAVSSGLILSGVFYFGFSGPAGGGFVGIGVAGLIASVFLYKF